jgi:cytochrome b-561
MGLFAIQFVIGFFSFLILLCCEGATAACRASLVPTHATFGLITFVMACATCMAGLTEKALFALKTTNYVNWTSNEAIIINALGVVIAAAAISIVFTLSVPSVRKAPMRMTYHTDL